MLDTIEALGPTLRKTRAPRSASPTFRMSNIVATTVSPTLRDDFKACTAELSTSRAIRTALMLHAEKVRNHQVPDKYRPPAKYQQQVNLSATLPDKDQRALYDTLARKWGITMSELILRCMSAYVQEAASKPTTPDAA